MPKATKTNCNWINVETIEKGQRKVVTPPENWIQDGKLRWPLKCVLSFRKKQANPEDGWLSLDYKFLAGPFASLEEALEKEKSLEYFSNSESEREFEKLRQQQRLHPVHCDLIDANDQFDKIQKQKTVTNGVAVNFDPILPLELMNGNYSQEEVNLSTVGEIFGTMMSSTVDQQQLPQIKNGQDSGNLMNNSVDLMNYSENNHNNQIHEDKIQVPGNTMPASTLSDCSEPVNSLAASNSQDSRNTITSQFQVQSNDNYNYRVPDMNFKGNNGENSGQTMSIPYSPHSNQATHNNYSAFNAPDPRSKFPSTSSQFASHSDQIPFHSSRFPSHSSHYQFNSNQFPSNWSQLPSNSNQSRFEQINYNHSNSNTEDGQNTRNIMVLDQTSLGPNPFVHPNKLGDKHITNTPMMKLQYSQSTLNERKGNEKNMLNGIKSKKIGKENRPAEKSVRNKNKKGVKKLSPKRKQKKRKALQKVLLKPYQLNNFTAFSKASDQSLPESSALTKSTESLTAFTPNTSKSTEDKDKDIDYLPLLYKEVLELKASCMADRKHFDERLDKIENVQMEISQKISVNEFADPFADESIEIFDEAYPIKEFEAVTTTNLKIFREPLYKAKLKYKFKNIGGQKARSMIRRCMKYFICDSILKKYGWKASPTKPPFHEFQCIWKTLREAVKETHKKYTDRRFDLYMGEFIKHAKTRYNREIDKASRKAKKNMQDKDEDDNEDGEETENEENESDKDDSGDSGDNENEEDSESEEEEDDE